jgi:hypothetical protein
MGAVEHIKEVADLVKKFNNIELDWRILKLEEEVLDRSCEKRRVEEKAEELERALKIRSELTFRENQYYLICDGKEDCPYCSLCWHRERKLIRMHDSSMLGVVCPGAAKTDSLRSEGSPTRTSSYISAASS